MNKMRMSVVAVAALLASASPALAQKGKGLGKGGVMPAPGHVLPFGHGKADPGRPFALPNTGNSLPQSTLDKLPPGLRDKPENHPGLTNHLRKLAGDRPPADLLNPSSRPPLTPDQSAARPFAQPKSGNSLTQEIRDRLPPGLRDMPENQPGLANHLRQLIPPTATPSAPTPAPAPVMAPRFQPLRGFLRGR